MAMGAKTLRHPGMDRTQDDDQEERRQDGFQQEADIIEITARRCSP